MKLQQLRYIVEIERQGLNVSEAAEALYTSQPGVSKQIRMLEDELGIAIFERSGKRFTGVTEPGRVAIDIAQRILREAENLQRACSEFISGESGRLVLATTHTQARYVLPTVVRDFMSQHPDIKLEMHQGTHTRLLTGWRRVRLTSVLPPKRWTRRHSSFPFRCSSGAIA